MNSSNRLKKKQLQKNIFFTGMVIFTCHHTLNYQTLLTINYPFPLDRYIQRTDLDWCNQF